jgi:MFS family permease
VTIGRRLLGSQAFAALEHRDFRLLFLSAVASGFGDQLQTVSNLWQVYALTGSALHLGLTGVARGVPIVLFSLVGGVLADRVDRRKVIILSQTGIGVCAVALAVVSALGLVEVWHIYLATSLSAILTALSNPARRALIATVVPRHQLMNGLALNMMVNQMDRIVAPSLAGILIAVVGLPLTYGLNGAAQVVTAGAVALIALRRASSMSVESPLRSLVEGLSFVRFRSVILALLVTDAAAMLFGSYQAILPIVADNFGLGVVGYGLLQSAPAVGAVVGAVTILTVGEIRYKGFLIVGAILGYCLCLVGLALAPWFSLALVVGGGLGLTNAMQATPRNAVIQLVTPDELRGRVSSFQQMLTSGMPSFGQGLMGAATGALGPAALVVGAILCAGVNVGVLLTRPDLRAPDLGAAPDTPAIRSGTIVPEPAPIV